MKTKYLFQAFIAALMVLPVILGCTMLQNSIPVFDASIQSKNATNFTISLSSSSQLNYSQIKNRCVGTVEQNASRCLFSFPSECSLSLIQKYVENETAFVL